MAKRYMSEEEYERQQFRWRHNLVDPHILQSVIDDGNGISDIDDEEEKTRKQELREQLWIQVSQKIEKSLTDRQKEAIYLFLMGKKQEHMGEILHITQEAANVRIRLGLERLRKECKKDEEILKTMEDINKT